MCLYTEEQIDLKSTHKTQCGGCIVSGCNCRHACVVYNICMKIIDLRRFDEAFHIWLKEICLWYLPQKSYPRLKITQVYHSYEAIIFKIHLKLRGRILDCSLLVYLFMTYETFK